MLAGMNPGIYFQMGHNERPFFKLFRWASESSKRQVDRVFEHVAGRCPSSNYEAWIEDIGDRCSVLFPNGCAIWCPDTGNLTLHMPRQRSHRMSCQNALDYNQLSTKPIFFRFIVGTGFWNWMSMIAPQEMISGKNKIFLGVLPRKLEGH
jgi:hypothetical protein